MGVREEEMNRTKEGYAQQSETGMCCGPSTSEMNKTVRFYVDRGEDLQGRECSSSLL